MERVSSPLKCDKKGTSDGQVQLVCIQCIPALDKSFIAIYSSFVGCLVASMVNGDAKFC